MERSVARIGLSLATLIMCSAGACLANFNGPAVPYTKLGDVYTGLTVTMTFIVFMSEFGFNICTFFAKKKSQFSVNVSFSVAEDDESLLMKKFGASKLQYIFRIGLPVFHFVWMTLLVIYAAAT